MNLNLGKKRIIASMTGLILVLSHAESAQNFTYPSRNGAARFTSNGNVVVRSPARQRSYSYRQPSYSRSYAPSNGYYYSSNGTNVYGQGVTTYRPYGTGGRAYVPQIGTQYRNGGYYGNSGYYGNGYANGYGNGTIYGGTRYYSSPQQARDASVGSAIGGAIGGNAGAQFGAAVGAQLQNP